MRRRQKQERAQSKQDSAIVALLEGRYGKAQQYAAGSAGGAAVVRASARDRGARGHRVRDFDAAERLLLRPDAQVASLAVPRLMLSAEMKLEQGQPQQALTQLRSLQQGGRDAHRGAAPGAARAASRGPLGRDPAAGRPAGQAQGLSTPTQADSCRA